MGRQGQSTIERTLVRLRADGWSLAEKVEHYNAHAYVRQDLFGFLDVLAIRPGVVLGIQACTGNADLSAHRTKLCQDRRDAVEAWLQSGAKCEIWSWRKKARPLKDGTVSTKLYWDVRIEPVTMAALIEWSARRQN